MKSYQFPSRKSGSYTSPGTPNYNNNVGGGIQKGWCSERVPLATNSSRGHVGAAALMPFTSGRTLPSKWDDAERWITSPVSGLGVNSNFPKSKSGPLGAPETFYYSNYSPALPLSQGGYAHARNFPFTTGVLVPDGISLQYRGPNSMLSYPVRTRNSMTRMASLPGWSDLLSESSTPSSPDENHGSTKMSETRESPVVSRRDMATQMSPQHSTHASPRGKSSFTTHQEAKFPNRASKMEVRDVQVDQQQATAPRRSRDRDLPEVEDLTSVWDIAEAAKNSSKIHREEAKITAWEKLQKAKAEAAMRKLEMKLEKERSASMDKIMNKLKTAQSKAQVMRSSVSDSQESEVSRRVVFFRKHVRLGSLWGCFSCHDV